MGAVGTVSSGNSYTRTDIENRGVKFNKSVDKLADDFQQSIVNQMGNMYKEFPQLQGVIKGVSVVKNVSTDMGFINGGAKDGMIVISDDFSGKTIQQLGKIDKAFVADDYSQLFTHEMAHALAKVLGTNASFKAFKGLSNKSDLAKLSNYANDMNDDEKFAEAVTDYMIHGNNASAVSKEVVTNIKKLLNK